MLANLYLFSAKRWEAFARVNFSKKKKMPCHVSHCSQPNWIDPSINVMPGKIIKIISVHRQNKQSECLFPAAVCVLGVFRELHPPDKLLPLPLYRDPAITLVCWHPEYQYNNASSFPLTHTTLSLTHTETHTHAHFNTTHPTQTPLKPLLKYKVAMTTARVHKSKRRGTLDSLKLLGGFLGGKGGRIWLKEVEVDRAFPSSFSVTCSRWCHVALPCHHCRLLRMAAIRRQVSWRFGVTVFGRGYKEEMWGGGEGAWCRVLTQR